MWRQASPRCTSNILQVLTCDGIDEVINARTDVVILDRRQPGCAVDATDEDRPNTPQAMARGYSEELDPLRARHLLCHFVS
jgi:hypothetical protein